MGVITDILGFTSSVTQSLAETGFAAMAGTVGDVLSAGSAVLVAILGINIVAQIKPMTFASFFAFGIKLSLIGLFAQSWDHFGVIANILIEVPQNLGIRMLQLVQGGGGGAGGLYAELDKIVAQATSYGDAIGDNAGWVFGAFAGVVVWVVAVIFSGIASFVIASATLLLTFLIIIAPIALLASLFKPTQSMFEMWTKTVMGYALMPWVAAGVVGITIAMIGQIVSTTPEAEAVTTLAQIFAFLVAFFICGGMLAQVPSLTIGLSGAIGLGAAGTGLVGLAQQGIVKQGMSLTGKAGRLGSNMVKNAQDNLNRASSSNPATNPSALLKQTTELRK